MNNSLGDKLKTTTCCLKHVKTAFNIKKEELLSSTRREEDHHVLLQNVTRTVAAASAPGVPHKIKSRPTMGPRNIIFVLYSNITK